MIEAEGGRWTRTEVAAVGLVVLTSLAALVYVASRNPFNLNPDAVAYLQIARHVAEQRINLAVNGYWGPLLSWLMVPLLAGGADRLVTARAVMVISTLVFLLGAISFFRAVGLRRSFLVVASLLTAAASMAWSIDSITPDLLAAGILLFACSKTLSAEWSASPRVQVLSGVAWGMGYLAKAIVLPVGIAVTVLAGCLAALTGDERRSGFRAAAVSLLAIAITSAPWIATLTIKYGKPTFSTTGAIAHALIGPPDVDRRNPLVLGFGTPEPGRLVASEDPSRIPFRYWSPFESAAYARHQMEVCSKNAKLIQSRIEAFDRFHLGFWSIIATLLALISRPRLISRYRWLSIPIPVVVTSLLYLPLWANDTRYYYYAYPLAVVAVFGFIAIISQGSRLAAAVLLTGAAFSFVLPIRDSLRVAAAGVSNPAVHAAMQLAQRLEALGLSGPVAGIGDVEGSMAALYVAFFLDVPWLGDEAVISIDDLGRSGAHLYIRSRRDTEEIAKIERESNFTNLDRRLFPDPETAARFPLVTFVRTGP